MRRPFYIATMVVLAILAFHNISTTHISLEWYIYFLLLICGIAAPMMLVLWLALTVTLKKKSPFLFTFNAVAVSMSTTVLLLLITFSLLHSAERPKPWADLPPAIVWLMSFVTCTLAYWFFLGRITKEKAAILSGQHDYHLFRKNNPDAVAKKLPDGLNIRNSLYIALFMAALQQPYYYLLYIIFLYFMAPAKAAVT